MKVVQVYEVARTAHLERARELADVTMLYRGKRYDYDQQAATKIDARRAGIIASAWFGLTNDVDVIEVNEPMVVRASVRSVVFIIAARARAKIVRRPRPIAVAYAIGNLSTAELRRALPLKAKVRSTLQRPFAGVLWSLLDRVAFGTRDAQVVYEREFGLNNAPQRKLVEALPAAAEDVLDRTPGPRPPVLVFLGDFSERKGFPDLLRAWPEVRSAVAESSLLLIGRGVGVNDALALAGSDERVEVVVDPPRSEIFTYLRGAKVLVLPSRRRPLWKEQVGLPITEGLAQGCLIVASAETGIADWLAQHGHVVVPEREVSTKLGAYLIAALQSPLSPGELSSQLPSIDGRQAARTWLYGGPAEIGALPQSTGGDSVRFAMLSLLSKLWHRRRLVPSYARGVFAGHPGTRIGKGVKLTGPGKYVLEPGSTITDGVRMWVGRGATFTMKRGSKIGDRSVVNVESAVTLEEGTRVSWDVQILDTDFHWLEGESGSRRPHTAAIVLGPHALVGARSMILKGVTVGDGAVVGAGSVVRRSVSPNTVVAGNPAQTVTTVLNWGSAAGG